MSQKFDLMPTLEIRSNASMYIRSCAASPKIRFELTTTCQNSIRTNDYIEIRTKDYFVIRTNAAPH